jgi:hypothetical protein
MPPAVSHTSQNNTFIAKEADAVSQLETLQAEARASCHDPESGRAIYQKLVHLHGQYGGYLPHHLWQWRGGFTFLGSAVVTVSTTIVRAAS